MPLFRSSGGSALRTLRLLEAQPLEPALGALRDSSAAMLRTLRAKADELHDCLEVSSRFARAGEPGRGMSTRAEVAAGGRGALAAAAGGGNYGHPPANARASQGAEKRPES
jgi:hypothetical protein